MQLRAWLLAGAASVLAMGTEAATPSDQLVVALTMNNILSLDPGAQTGSESAEIVSNAYDALLRTDPADKAKLLPMLATEWSISADDKEITLKLRPDVKFHSGNPVTADDFVWSVARALKANLNQSTTWKSYGFTGQNVDQFITAPDPQTVRISLPQPTDPILVVYTLANLSVIDRKTAMAKEKSGDFGQGYLTTTAAGSGAFTIQNWQANNIITLQRADSYWQEPAKLRRVIYRHMPESQTQRLMLEKGDIDIAMNLSVPDLRAMQNNKDVKIQVVPGGNIYYLAVSMKDPKFQDRRVRLALRHLIDYQAINDTIMPFYGVLHQRPIQKGVMGDLPEPGYKLDVAYAKQMLAEAGFPDGFETTIRVLPDSPFLDVATAIQATLAQAGVKAKIQTGNGDQTYGAMRSRTFEMVVGRGGGGGDPHPHSSLRSQAYNPDNRDEAKLSAFQGWRTGFFDEKLNQMIDTALLEHDKTKQRAMYEDIQRYYEELVPAMQPISQVTDPIAIRADVQGYQYHPSWTTRYRDVSKAR